MRTDINITLNQEHLPLLPPAVAKPAYDRTRVKAGIAHIGVGGFHRAHEAFYTDRLLECSDRLDWGILGIALLPRDRRIFDTLSRQDGLYTLMVTQADGELSARVIGSIVECLYAPENPARVIARIADPSIRILTMTITEGGYNFDASGAFQLGDPDIQWDLQHPEAPRTVFGYVRAALQLRRVAQLPMTIQSCDNIQQNGDVAKRMFLAFIREADPGLAGWVEAHVTFPNSMVDRITPVTSPSDGERLLNQFHYVDRWPVVSESFHQWIIEDEFASGRPGWDLVGAQFVSDVHPYEKMKIRLVNGGHSLLGLTGYLAGYQYIDEAARDPLLSTLFTRYMDTEVTPILDEIPGIDLTDYKHTVLTRFGSPYIKDKVTRIIGESAAKIPKFILPTIREQMAGAGAFRASTLVVAAWYCYLVQIVTLRATEELQDAMKAVLVETIEASLAGGPLVFLRIENIFGDLAGSPQFTQTFLELVESIRRDGIKRTLEDTLTGQGPLPAD